MFTHLYVFDTYVQLRQQLRTRLQAADAIFGQAKHKERRESLNALPSGTARKFIQSIQNSEEPRKWSDYAANDRTQEKVMCSCLSF